VCFPGTGADIWARQNHDRHVFMTYPGIFDRKDFPGNFITHMREQISHRAACVLSIVDREAIQALVDADIDFLLLWPAPSAKDWILEQLRQDRVTKDFIEIRDQNFEADLAYCKSLPAADNVQLHPGETFESVIEYNDQSRTFRRRQ
jgi:hypothetical protein